MTYCIEKPVCVIRSYEPPCIMSSLPNWVVWGWWNRDGSKVKMPYNPKTGKAAKTNEPSTWGTYSEARYRYERNTKRYAGLGFVFSEGTGLFGIDLDGCLDKGRLSNWAMNIANNFLTYSEVSPSETGIKIFGIGEVPTGVKLKIKVAGDPVDGKKPGIEVYGKARLFCYTGMRISMHTELHDCSSELFRLIKKIQPKEKPIQLSRKNTREHGVASVEIARNWLAKHGPAYSGQFGHTHTYTAALALVDGFGLDQQTALDLLREWNTSCVPPWSERDLVRKIQQASRR